VCLPILVIRQMYTQCNHRPTRMVANNQEGIRRKDIITIRVGKMVIKLRTIMRRPVLMLERENEKNIR
jgi:hypothetical protein